MASSEKLRWGRSTVESGCPLDCPDACSLNVSVENGRVIAIDGSQRNPVTSDFICAKVRGFAGRVYGELRVLTPLIRKGPKGRGQFTPATWDDALDLVASRIRETADAHGGEAILPFSYGGSNGLVTQGTADAELFRQLGASRLARTVCAAPTGAAATGMYGKMAGVGYADYAHARLIIVWGANPTTSGIHLVPFIKQARERGATLVVIDPRATAMARQADHHLAIRPGSDVAVALAIHRHLFEGGHADDAFLAAHTHDADRLRARAREWTFERAADVAGIDAAQIAMLAELYASMSPAVIRCGWGLERNRNGGNAALAVLALPAVANKFGVRGGGYTMSNSGAYGYSSAQWLTTPEPATRIVNMNRLGRVLNDDPAPVRVLFVYNANPVATIPDQGRVIAGLEREDLFTVVHDQVLTDTAMYADVVLPATTFLEHYDVARGYGAYHMQMVRPAIEPVGQARPNTEVFAALAERLGLVTSDTADDGDSLACLRVTAALPEPLRGGVQSDAGAAPAAGTTPVQFVDVFPLTPDRKVHLWPAALDAEAAGGLYVYQADPATPAFPLALISPASEKTISSTLGELRERVVSVSIHPDDAAPRLIEDGDTVRVWNALGEVHCLASVTPRIARGTASLPKGLWRKSTFNQATANALAPDTLSDLGGGACFNDARVEVTRMVSAAFGDTPLSLWVGPPGTSQPH